MNTLKRIVDRYILAGIPYLDVLVCRDHRPCMRYKNGHAPISGREQLYMYSCTKPMTMAAVMRLIEDGQFTLDTPVGDILPAYRHLYIEEDGVRRASRTTLTIRHLMTMSGGLSYDFAHYPIETDRHPTEGHSVTRSIVDSLAKAPLYFDPGTRYQYSLCHDVLGAVIEEAAGMRFGAYMTKMFWEPLGMTSTRFGSPHDERVAPQYIVKDGRVVPMDKSCVFVFTEGYESGGAGTISCVEDYSRFADMYACGGVSADGQRLLSEQSIQLLRTPQLGIAEGFLCNLGDCSDYAYGLGMRTRLHDSPAGLHVGEFGWDGAAGCLLLADEAQHLSIVVGMHLREWYTMFRDVHRNIIDAVFEDLKHI